MPRRKKVVEENTEALDETEIKEIEALEEANEIEIEKPSKKQAEKKEEKPADDEKKSLLEEQKEKELTEAEENRIIKAQKKSEKKRLTKFKLGKTREHIDRVETNINTGLNDEQVNERLVKGYVNIKNTKTT